MLGLVGPVRTMAGMMNVGLTVGMNGTRARSGRFGSQNKHLSFIARHKRSDEELISFSLRFYFSRLIPSCPACVFSNGKTVVGWIPSRQRTTPNPPIITSTIFRDWFNISKCFQSLISESTTTAVSSVCVCSYNVSTLFTKKAPLKKCDKFEHKPQWSKKQSWNKWKHTHFQIGTLLTQFFLHSGRILKVLSSSLRCVILSSVSVWCG